MLSTSLNHYPTAFAHLSPQGMVGPHHQQHQHHVSAPGLDALAQSSHYLQQMQYDRRQLYSNQPPTLKQPPQRHHPYAIASMDHPMFDQRARHPAERGGRSVSNSGPVRRRISRACDQCNQLRTKCDGRHPCAHCVEFGLTCEYMRERKKRGKASRKDIAAQQAAAAAAASGKTSDGSDVSPTESEAPKDGRLDGSTHEDQKQESDYGQVTPKSAVPPRSASLSSSGFMDSQMNYREDMASLDHINELTDGSASAPPSAVEPHSPNSSDGMHRQSMSNTSLGQFSTGQAYDHNVMQQSMQGPGQQPVQNANGLLHHSNYQAQNLQNFGNNGMPMASPTMHQMSSNPFQMGAGASPTTMQGMLGNSPVAASPGWFSLPSPSTTIYNQASLSSVQALRYPVLQPLLPHLGSILPVSIACDLLDVYFQSSSLEYMQPQSPYVLGFVFRKRSFLRSTNPRVCSPALLASMLWIGAQTCENAFFTSPPSSRGKVCQKLLELTVSLLKPLIHTPPPSNDAPHYGANAIFNGVALGGFGAAVTGPSPDADSSGPGATGAIDDVATYMHLATVVSATEYKAASLRWWNAAWSLARELKLGREPPESSSSLQGQSNDDVDADGEADLDMGAPNPAGQDMSTGLQSPAAAPVSEEEREERRRIWWLLYTMDRHLSLCYNKPLFLLDIECDSLLHPVDDIFWQTGEYYNEVAARQAYRRAGPSYECGGQSTFGYFTPLMTILGEIIDLNYARNHPRFGHRFRGSAEWDAQAAEIVDQLEAYGRSLKDLEARCNNHFADTNGDLEASSPSVHSVSTNGTRGYESILQTKIVIAYGTYLMHTMHILLNGKWDPISLLDDNDLWISSQSFVTATGHAVSAAEALNDVLEHDPDLSYMPFFFGIYLLQGSFLLLLIADKLQGDASPSVVKACETIVRAHEACVATLNTEYQRNFRKVMRSALAQVKGRCVEDFGEQQARRREVLALYRWTGDGSGLAL